MNQLAITFLELARREGFEEARVRLVPQGKTHGIHAVTKDQVFLWKIKRINENGCWEFNRTKDQFGYGRFRYRIVTFKAHRFSWEFFVGPIPDGLWVLHKCDNPPCCNPDHLFLGTHQDNMDDMYGKGRRTVPTGEDHYRSKLKAEDVLAIRQSAEHETELARRFGVSRNTIHDARTGRRWKCV